jgi:transcriptional regulator with XRE-family HTH domain
MVMLTPQDIRGLRLAMGLTGAEFAQRVGVSEDTIWRWEKGNRHPNYKRMEKLNELREAHIKKVFTPA